MTKLAQTDAIGRAKANYLAHSDPTFKTYGPKTRREFFQFAGMDH